MAPPRRNDLPDVDDEPTFKIGAVYGVTGRSLLLWVLTPP
jgi:hypothetical protein